MANDDAKFLFDVSKRADKAVNDPMFGIAYAVLTDDIPRLLAMIADRDEKLRVAKEALTPKPRGPLSDADRNFMKAKIADSSVCMEQKVSYQTDLNWDDAHRAALDRAERAESGLRNMKDELVKVNVQLSAESIRAERAEAEAKHYEWRLRNEHQEVVRLSTQNLALAAEAQRLRAAIVNHVGYIDYCLMRSEKVGEEKTSIMLLKAPVKSALDALSTPFAAAALFVGTLKYVR